MRKITTQERAAILAGLRLLQETIGDNSGNLPDGIEDVFTNGYTIDVEEQLTLEDMDRLCEEINTSHVLVTDPAEVQLMIDAVDILNPDTDAGCHARDTLALELRDALKPEEVNDGD